jgi:hypothetical protein
MVIVFNNKIVGLGGKSGIAFPTAYHIPALNKILIS